MALDGDGIFYISRTTEIKAAVTRLSALAQESRLAGFRLLVQAGRDGMAAGEVARALGIPANTLSAQFTVLANAGLVTSRRDGRSILYAADYDGMSDLLVFLMEVTGKTSILPSTRPRRAVLGTRFPASLPSLRNDQSLS